jgi:aminoglycoside phosphotransferase (APT) family kinase protein
MEGATSSAVHAVDVEHGGRVLELVLRRFVRADWLADEPDLAEREAEALALLESTPVAAPVLVAVDVDGRECGVPAVLMTRLAGRPTDDPGELEARLRLLAEPLPVINAVAVPVGTHVRSYRPYYVDDDLRPPTWAARPALWERAIEVHQGPQPEARERLIHRDYHPGNVLWEGSRLTGVIDWANTSRGAAAADVGHCRLNLHGQFDDAADRFLAAWWAVSGETGYHPYWDIVAAVGFLPSRGGPSEDTAAVEDFIARAVARL